MKNGVRALLTVIFLAIALLLLGGFNVSKPRILVLHSFDRNTPLAKKMDEGIRLALDRNRQPLNVKWHYLAMDRFPDEDHREDSAKSGHRAIDHFDPDVLIAVDDDAQQYVARQYAGRTRPKVVFTAIDKKPETYGYTKVANVTGIVEVLPLAAIRDTLLALHPGKPARIGVLAQVGPAGDGQVQQVQAFDWSPHQVVVLHALEDFAGWQAAITAMRGQTDALLVLSYEGLPASIGDKKPLPPADIARWIEAHSDAVPIGIETAYAELGGALSVAPSQHEMGEAAVQITLDWLKAKPGGPPPITRGNRYRVAIGAAALRARGLSLPSIYVEAARLDQLYFP